MAPSFHATVLVKDADAAEYTPARTVEHNGKTYVVAAPGQQFKVEAEARCLLPATYFHTGLDIDGRSAGYAYFLSLDKNKSTFHGWYAGKGEHTDFTFLPSTARGDGAEPGVESGSGAGSLGKIEVTFQQNVKVACGLLAPGRGRGRKRGAARCSHCESHSRWFHGAGVPEARGEGPFAAPARPAAEDKKFFLKPSLRATSLGTVCHTVADAGSQHMTALPGAATVRVTFQCETAEILQLRRILPPGPLRPPCPTAQGRGGGSLASAPETPPKKAVKLEPRAGSQNAGEGNAGQQNLPGAMATADGARLAAEGSAGGSAEAAIVITEEVDLTRRRLRGSGNAASPITLLDDDESECIAGRKRRRQKSVWHAEGDKEDKVWMWQEDPHAEVVDLD